ncbi:hypothetical protein [Paraburkholderia sp. MM5477-R1]|uniref:hypothetical protein n=1 Tax=Paraburkholderia sp. MM5477-R1 TaxID=2991062 RepID=UPI003D1A2D93
MSIKSKMMGTTLMSVLAAVYDGRREVLTFQTRRISANNRAIEKPLGNSRGLLSAALLVSGSELSLSETVVCPMLPAGKPPIYACRRSMRYQ